MLLCVGAGVAAYCVRRHRKPKPEIAVAPRVEEPLTPQPDEKLVEWNEARAYKYYIDEKTPQLEPQAKIPSDGLVWKDAEFRQVMRFSQQAYASI